MKLKIISIASIFIVRRRSSVYLGDWGK